MKNTTEACIHYLKFLKGASLEIKNTKKVLRDIDKKSLLVCFSNFRLHFAPRPAANGLDCTKGTWRRVSWCPAASWKTLERRALKPSLDYHSDIFFSRAPAQLGLPGERHVFDGPQCCLLKTTDGKCTARELSCLFTS
eukprot:GEMP01045645.1.p1 GENE.GEMP01045645.1~~GEMP01045645.1.p1  ORF type:complete len:138 (-),score=13.96 GEMP01045645.1:14-427(-)